MKKRYILLLAVGFIAVVVGASLFGYGRWDNSRTFVTAGNAQVEADLIDVGPINSGRIRQMNVEEGDSVSVGDVIAILDIEATISTPDAMTSTGSETQEVAERKVEVLSAPMDAVVAARWAVEGATVSADQRVVTLLDTRDIWVVANIREGDIQKVRIGQKVEVRVASSGAPLTGRVERISRTTKDALEQPQGSSNNSLRMTKVVPVTVSLDEGHHLLIPGSSADVKIRVR